MAQARRRIKIGLCWGWVLSLWRWRRGACSADDLEARQPAYTWAAVQKRGAITLQKNSGLAGVITFLWRGLFSHDLNTSSSKSPYAVNRSGESSGCSASLLWADWHTLCTHTRFPECKRGICPAIMLKRRMPYINQVIFTWHRCHHRFSIWHRCGDRGNPWSTGTRWKLLVLAHSTIHMLFNIHAVSKQTNIVLVTVTPFTCVTSHI